MTPKIIHNIWLQGYENLPNEIKINYLNIKKQNPEWEFMIWDDDMIKKLLKKNTSLYELYTNNTYSTFEKESIQTHIARYVIMKEYGGMYFDMDIKCTSSFDNLFSHESHDSKNTIYIINSEMNYWNYIYSLQKTKYSSNFMAMDKNHPIWDKVIEKLKHATTKYAIVNALDSSLQQNENADKTNASAVAFPIVILEKVNGSDYQCENKDDICYKSNAYSSNFFNKAFKYISCFHKQIILFIFAVIIIIGVEYLYMQNAMTFGAMNFIPGMPGSAAPPSQPILQKKKGKEKTKITQYFL